MPQGTVESQSTTTGRPRGGISFRLRRALAWARRAHAIRRFRWRWSWLGPEDANAMFRSVTSDLLTPLLRAQGATIGTGCDLSTPAIFHGFTRRLEGQEGSGYARLVIGDRCHVGRDCFFDLWNRITLGDRVAVAMRCTFLTHISVGPSVLRSLYPTVSAPIVVGDDSYIGAGATLLHGVTLGRRCLVAAGSVVTRSFADGCLIAGVPARKIRDLPDGPED